MLLGLAAPAALLAACSPQTDRVRNGPAPTLLVRPMQPVGPRALLGRPYWIEGRLFEPRADPFYDRTGQASVIGARDHGEPTANGERIDTRALIAAHPTLPLPALLEITNLETGCMLLVRANDRGPFVRERIVSVSPRAAELLGFGRSGLAEVRVRFVRSAPLDGDAGAEQAYLARFPDRGCGAGVGALHWQTNWRARDEW